MMRTNNERLLSMSRLAARLSVMAAEDQEMRGSGIWDCEVDHRNTAEMKEIVGRHGWPTISLVGSEASNHAWLLVQHADHDPVFQEHCLQLMKRCAGNEIRSADIAYLEDRVRVNTGRPQLYGTQFHEIEGLAVPQVIESPEGVNERRRAAGLEDLELYTVRMREVFEAAKLRASA